MSELVVSSRDALAQALFETSSGYPWGETHRMVRAVFYKQADALLASGVVRALPDEETVADVLKSAHAAWYSSHVELHTFMARAALALFTEGDKE